MTKRAKIQKKGRICKSAGCKHVLSVYNSGLLCYVHQQSGAVETPKQAKA